MKYFISSYNQDCEWVKDYTDDFEIWEQGKDNSMPHRKVPHGGSDICDKFGWIIENYNKLPDKVVLAKANLFKYITKEEYDIIKNNNTFTPILTQYHKTYADGVSQVNFYRDNIYWERNDGWYLAAHMATRAEELLRALNIIDMKYLPFAPGANYILPKENILKYDRDWYEYLRSFLISGTNLYPGEAQIMERGLYTLWS